MPWMLTEFGYTTGCPRCAYRSVHQKCTGGTAHSEAFRSRLIKCLGAREDVKERSTVARFHGRANDELDHLLKHDARRGERGYELYRHPWPWTRDE